MTRRHGRTVMVVAFFLVLVSLGCSSDNPAFNPDAGTGTGGSGTGGDVDACPCTLLDLSVSGLEVDLSDAADGDQVLPDGTFELSWTVSYNAVDCESVLPSADFIEQVRVTRGDVSPQLEVAEEALTLAPGESMDRSLLSSALFEVLGPTSYTAEVWLIDVDPANAECPVDGGVVDDNAGAGAQSLSFNLPPA